MPMRNIKKTAVRAGGQCGYRGVLTALAFLLTACPAAVGAAGNSAAAAGSVHSAAATDTELPADAAAFSEFQSILRGYPDLFFESDVLQILQEDAVSREQFEKDVAAYVLKENEWGYVTREESEYPLAVQDFKLLRRAVGTVSEKAEALRDALQSFARKSAQAALDNGAATEDVRITAEDAEMACEEFSLAVVRLFARDLVAFRSHAPWLDGNMQSSPPNQVSCSVAVAQYLSSSGNNAEIVMSTGAAQHLWTRQLAVAESDLFALEDAWEEGHRRYTDPISRAEWSAPRETAEKTLAALRKEWEGVRNAYTAYADAWEEAFAPMSGYRGSGTPYWCAGMRMHLFAHWEELVSSLLLREQLLLSDVNRDCFRLTLPGNEAAEFADIYVGKLSEAVKRLAGDEEFPKREIMALRERVARLYDARMRCAVAGISCEFCDDDSRIAEETEKARQLIRETMLQDISEMCCASTENTALDALCNVYCSRNGAELWRKQMELMIAEIANSYSDADCPEPFCGAANPEAADFSDTHMLRIQDLLEETNAAWHWYRWNWFVLLCNINAPQFDCDKQELRLHALREQWLRFLYKRAYGCSDNDCSENDCSES